MENNEFEKVETKKKKNRGIVKSHKKNKLAKIATVLLIASLISIFAGCTSSCNPDKDDPSIDDPGIVEPLPDEPETPDEPEIPDKPDDPVIDPDDPVIDPDPENPGEDIPPEDVPPEDVPPEDKPPEEENPGDEDIPDSIDKVDEVDEINYFADEFTQILNETHLESLAKQFIGRNGTADDISSTEWMITNSNNNDQIKELQVKVYYDYGTTRFFKVGQVTFNQAYSVQDIINGNATDATYSVAYRDSEVALNDIVNNTDLGKTVIQTIDANNNLKGDIWCSIGTAGVEGGKTYRNITVYQITDEGVQKYSMKTEAPSVDPDSIIDNINNGLYDKDYTSQSTEYTFAGEKIEQTKASSQNLAIYNYDFDDIELC